MASCAYTFQKYSYERTVLEEWALMKQGLYNINGGDESSIDEGGFDAYTMKTELHFSQVGVEKRF